MVSFIPKCVSNLTGTLNKKKVASVVGMQNPEPCTSTGVQTLRKSTSLIPKRKTTLPKASSVPKSTIRYCDIAMKGRGSEWTLH